MQGDSITGCISRKEMDIFNDRNISSKHINAKSDAMHWMYNFKHLVRPNDEQETPKFDAIVTNPPWISLGGRNVTKYEELKEYFSTVREISKSGLYKILPEGQLNMYHLFLERCVRLLNRNHGQLGFLVQASILGAKWKDPRCAEKTSSYLLKVTKGMNISSLLEFSLNALFENVCQTCVIFTASQGNKNTSFPYRKFTRKETRSLKLLSNNGLRYSLEPMVRIEVNPSGDFIINVLHPKSMPLRILDLLKAYIDPESSHTRWMKYEDYCAVSQGHYRKNKDAISPKGTRVGAIPIIKNGKVQHFALVGEENADFWVLSTKSSDYPIRLATKKVMCVENPRRLRCAILLDSSEDRVVWGADGTVIHDFSGMPDFGVSVFERAYIFCCLMNSDLLECIIRSFDRTHNLSSGKIKVLPLPDLKLGSMPAGWKPNWRTLESLNPNSSISLILDSLDAPCTKNKTGCVLSCLSVIGEHMHTLIETDRKGIATYPRKAKNVLTMMNRMINSLYELTDDDEEYIIEFYRLLNIYDKRT
jgi:hypothetical protein